MQTVVSLRFQQSALRHLVVMFYLNVQQKEARDNPPMLSENGPYSNSFYHARPDWVDQEFPKLVPYLEGNLVIDVIDRRTSEMIWKSSTVGYSELGESPTREQIWKGVERAMKGLPMKTEE